MYNLKPFFESDGPEVRFTKMICFASGVWYLLNSFQYWIWSGTYSAFSLVFAAVMFWISIDPFRRWLAGVFITFQKQINHATRTIFNIRKRPVL